MWRNTGIDVVGQYTNGNTGNTANDGFLVGIDGNGAGMLKQQENSFIDIYTNSNTVTAPMASFTSGDALGTGATAGDGMRIYDATSGTGHLDLWTSISFQTHIKFGGSGLIQGANNRFEVIGNNAGLWFNTTSGRYIFNNNSTEHARVGGNAFWRIGANPLNLDAARQLEVFHASVPQFRITRSTSILFTDFETNGSGNLRINPTGGRVSINLAAGSNPTHTLDVNGNLRVRNVSLTTAPNSLIVGVDQTGVNDLEIRRLSFTGSATDVLLGDGTWGAVNTNANNGLIVNTGTVQLGQATCASTGAGQLIRHSYIPMNNFNLVFTDAGTAQDNTTNRIGIGVCSPTAKLEVFRSLATTLVDFQPVGIRVTNADISSPGTNTQLSWGLLSSTTGRNRVNYGGDFRVYNAISNTAVQGWASTTQSPSGSSGVNTAGYFQASDNRFNYGVRGLAFNHTAGGADYAGHFTGDLLYTGNLIPPSDAQLKDSINDVSNALSIISRLRPKNYIFRTDSFPYMNLPSGLHYGFIAQEVDTVLPELVANVFFPGVTDTVGNLIGDTLHYNGISYTDFIPLAIAGIQEQQAIIDSMRSKQVTADATGITDTNRLVKWSFTDRELTNSLVYDDGNRVGIPAVKQGSYLNVENTGTDTVAVRAVSTNTSTQTVVSAVYNTDSADHTVVAVRGYAKYKNEIGEDAGRGGSFEGAESGIFATGSGNGIGLVTGVYGQATSTDAASVGVVGIANGLNTTNSNAGIAGTAENSDQANFGVSASAEGLTTTAYNVGVHSVAGGSQLQNAAGYFEAYDTTGVNYGVFAYASGTAPTAYAGYFDGDVHVTGNLTWASDQQLKTNMQNLEKDSALQIIMRLQPKTYNFRTQDYPYLSLAEGKQYGLLAQEAETVVPNLVTDVIQPARIDKQGNELSPQMQYKGLNYAGLIPVLIGAVKEQQVKAEEQQNKIDSLSEVITNRLDALEARLNGCCGTGSANKTADENAATPHQLTVELSSTQVVILEQNVPNPFAEQTSISYFIPENITNAQLVFTDILGNNIKQVEVKSGYGTVTVFASNLTSGQYSYSLVIDGQVVETKRMVKTK